MGTQQYRRPARNFNPRCTNDLTALTGAYRCGLCLDPIVEQVGCVIPEMYVPGSTSYGDLPVEIIAEENWATDDTIVAPPASSLSTPWKTAGHIQTRNVLAGMLADMRMQRTPGGMIWQWAPGTDGYDGPRNISRTLTRTIITSVNPSSVSDDWTTYPADWSYSGTQQVDLTSVSLGWHKTLCQFNFSFTMAAQQIQYAGAYPNMPSFTASNALRNAILAKWPPSTLPNPLVIYPNCSVAGGIIFIPGGPRGFPFPYFGRVDTVDDPSFPPFGLAIDTRYNLDGFPPPPDFTKDLWSRFTQTYAATYGPGGVSRVPLSMRSYFRSENPSSLGSQLPQASTFQIPPVFSAQKFFLWNPSVTPAEVAANGLQAILPINRQSDYIPLLTTSSQIPYSGGPVLPNPTYVWGFGIHGHWP